MIMHIGLRCEMNLVGAEQMPAYVYKVRHTYCVHATGIPPHIRLHMYLEH